MGPSSCIFNEYQTRSHMDYTESFLSCCDAEGKAPVWAIHLIFNEHGLDLDEWTEIATDNEIDDGEAILHFCGY